MCISIADVLGTRVNNSSGQQNFMKTFHNEANTSKSFSEALILASNNPQYDKRLFIDLPVQYMKTASSEHVVYINCSECQNKNKKNNLCTQHVLSL